VIKNEQDLLALAHQLCGLTIAQLAERLNEIVPDNSLHAKGFVGQLIERALGANSGNLPVADFPDLGVELKTIPINTKGKPRESTYICMVPLKAQYHIVFEQTVVYQKLQRILWIPIESEPHTQVSARRIGQPLLWSPNEIQFQQLRADWQELVDMIAMGELEMLSAQIGEYLHIRPKAADARSLTKSINFLGETTQTLPRGFYLRSVLTEQIINRSQQKKN